jgi:hypothetical protein
MKTMIGKPLGKQRAWTREIKAHFPRIPNEKKEKR